MSAPGNDAPRLTVCPETGKYVCRETGASYDRVTDVLRMCDYVQDGLVFAGASMAASRAAQMVEAAMKGEAWARPTVVDGEPAVVPQPLLGFDVRGWLSKCPAAAMEAARNRGNLVDALAKRFCAEGPLGPEDAALWAVQAGHDRLLSFDPGDVAARAAVFAAWWEKVGPEPVAWDVTVYDDALGVAGTLDLVLRAGGGLYVVDVKAGAYNDAYALQAAAYWAMPGHCGPEGFDVAMRASTPALVCVGPERAQFRPVADPAACAEAFRAAVALYRALGQRCLAPSGGMGATADEFALAGAQAAVL